MKYIFAAQFYWPIWLTFKYYEMTWLGMLAGVVFVLISWRVMWVMEFGKDKK